jgi:transposase InsO family protein
VKYAFIRDHAKEWPVRRLCQVLEVSRSGYYGWLDRRPSARAHADARLGRLIVSVHRASRRRYGSPRVWQELRAQGERCGRHRVARLMRHLGIRARGARKYKVTTESVHGYAVAPNRLRQKFSAPAPNRRWASDITYVPTREGWLYLAVVLDLYSRAIVGWSVKPRLTRALVCDALTMALWRRNTGKGLVTHSDRGSQYASGEYQQMLKINGIQCSMSRKGNCYDNAPVESFFATLKKELLHTDIPGNRASVRADIFEYIEVFYNRIRRHSTLGYVSPMDYERQTDWANAVSV